MSPKVSICIATWKRKEKLNRIILNLEDQTMDPTEYEVIVVDSNSPDGTDILMKDLCAKYPNIVYISDADNILAVKRNVGIRNAKAETIVFMDDDVIPNDAFVESHYIANKNNNDTFFCGQIRFPHDLVNNSNYYCFRDEQHLQDKDIGVDLPFNRIVVMNLSFRKSFIEKVGYVNEEFIGYGDEDIEFGYRVVKSGFKIRYLPNALGIHEEESSGIKEYGRKLYKAGLYGDRILRKECIEAYNALEGKRIIGYFLAVKPICECIAKYLDKNDTNTNKYSYYLYKMYLYGMSYRGRLDQKKHNELSADMAKTGW